ncbi:DoxX family protein [Larkinella bovis]|uniref:DoxX family protein n=1 Tax=Larkinella bovis TaxID=683041 RepID=A0ABW0IIU3_9BACT
MNAYSYAFLTARLTVAASFIGHGVVRLPKLTAFSDWMVGLFEKTILPDFLVRPYSMAVPVIELVLGVTLLVGLFTRASLIGATFLLLSLIFGSNLVEEWNWITSQMIYCLFFVFMFMNMEHNQWALDHIFRKSGRPKRVAELV